MSSSDDVDATNDESSTGGMPTGEAVFAGAGGMLFVLVIFAIIAYVVKASAQSGWFEIQQARLKASLLEVIGASLSLVPFTLLVIVVFLFAMTKIKRYGYIAAGMVLIALFGVPVFNWAYYWIARGLAIIPGLQGIDNYTTGSNWYNTFMSPSISDCRVAILAPFGGAGDMGDSMTIPNSSYVCLCVYAPLIMSLVLSDHPVNNPVSPEGLGAASGVLAVVSLLAIMLRKYMLSCESMQATVMGASLGLFFAGLHATFVFPLDGSSSPGLYDTRPPALRSQSCSSVIGEQEGDLEYVIYSDGNMVGTIQGSASHSNT
jgi:hypothetical protein